MSFERLTSKKLNELLNSPIKMRAYCVRTESDIVEVQDKIEELIYARERRRVGGGSTGRRQNFTNANSGVLGAEDIVLRVLKNEFQSQQFSSKTHTLEQVAERAAIDLKARDLETGVNSPLEGFVANVIYREVERLKYGGKNVRPWRKKFFPIDIMKRLRVQFDETSQAQILGHLNPNYVRTNYAFVDGRLMFRDRKTGKTVPNPNIEGIENWDGDEKEDTRQKLLNIVEERLLPNFSRKQVHYLGLEGPNFRSFLELAIPLQERGLKLRGNFIEYDRKTYDLMISLHESGILGKTFHGCNFMYGDIDNAMLLDFVPNHKVIMKIDHSRNKDPDLPMKVLYSDDKRGIRVVDYHRMLSELDAGLSFGKASRQYKISRDFVEAVAERGNRKFDVAFLDFVGPFTSRRKKALKYLVQNRLADQAVLAATFNISSRTNPHDRGPVGAMPAKFFDKFLKIFSDYGFRTRGIDSCSYTESSGLDRMSFQVHYLERQKQN